MTSACLKVWSSQAQTKAKAGGSHPALQELSKGRGPKPRAEIIGKADFPNAVTPLPAYTSDTEVRWQPSPAQYEQRPERDVEGAAKAMNSRMMWDGWEPHPTPADTPGTILKNWKHIAGYTLQIAALSSPSGKEPISPRFRSIHLSVGGSACHQDCLILALGLCRGRAPGLLLTRPALSGWDMSLGDYGWETFVF